MKKVPVTIITWFLWSWKTTLINKILKENKNLKIALIVNEFWDVSLESQFIESTDEEIVEMSNGCMCCVVRQDIIDTVKMILTKRPDVDYIIVEASWLSDPVPIAETFAMNLTDEIRLDAIISVVDALNIEKNFKNYEIAQNQILYSDIVLVSKTSLISPQKYQEVKFFLKKLNPFLRIFPIDETLTLDMILDTEKYDYAKVEELETSHAHHCHDEGCNHDHTHAHKHEAVDEVFIKIDKALSMEKFGELLKHMPQEIVRGKGFIYPADEQFWWKKILFQYVGVRIDTDIKEWVWSEKKQTALVFIWKWYDTQAFKQSLLDCIE